MFARSDDAEFDVEIVGESHALKRVLALAKNAAQTDSPVLIFGEPGSGKELIARAIHRVGPRRKGSFVMVGSGSAGNELLEKELFGLESGVLDNANQQASGLEQANQGTLFLDEIDKFPLELQPKLLRVLERRTFERVGGTRSIPINVRVIVATSANLETLVSEDTFHRDLYQQLNTFPIRVPSLRERRSDVPLLARYFLQKFSRRVNKVIETIPPETMNTLQNQDWPDNVRELENLIERAVTLTEGSTLTIPGT